tara:strand:- start:2320 stop:3333 length:1014 start_codon:yes stop_codon:yes gene_type:complete
MATNFHSDLPNDQIHNPKDYSIAENSSVLTKDKDGGLDWLAKPFNLSTTIACGSDVAGSLHNKSFLIYYSSAITFEVHFTVTGETEPYTTKTTFVQSEVVIAPNDTAITVAAAIKTELDSLTATIAAVDFVTSVNGHGKVTFSGMKNTQNTVDEDTGFAITNTKTPTGQQVLKSEPNGTLSWSNEIYEQSYNFFSKAVEGGTISFLEFDRASYGNFNLNLGSTTLPATFDIRKAVGASIYHAHQDSSLIGMDIIMVSTTVPGPVTIGLCKADITCGTAGNPPITDIVSQTVTLSAATPECITLAPTTTHEFNKHDLLIPYIAPGVNVSIAARLHILK